MYVSSLSDVILTALRSNLASRDTPLFSWSFSTAFPSFSLHFFFDKIDFPLILSTSTNLYIFFSYPNPHYPPFLPSSSSGQTSTAKHRTTDNVSHAVCDWQLGKMAVAAHREMENPFSGCTTVSTCVHLSAWETGAKTISPSWPTVSHAQGQGEAKEARSCPNKHEDQQMALCQSADSF